MDYSVFLAKFMGIYLLIVSAIWLLRKDQFETSIQDLVSSKAVLAFGGAFNLLFGLAIAVGHPIWQADWKGMITLIGYLSIVKGVFRLGFPIQDQRIVNFALKRGYWIVFAVMLALGLFLTYCGFTRS